MLNALLQLREADGGQVHIVGTRQQALRARAQRLLQLAEEGTGREQSDGLAKSLLRAALQPFAEFTRELQMLLALSVDVRLEGGSPVRARSARVPPCRHRGRCCAGGWRVLERLQRGEVAVRFLLQQAGVGSIGDQDHWGFMAVSLRLGAMREP